jgi:cell division protein FtsL
MSDAPVRAVAPERRQHPAGAARPRPDLRIVADREFSARGRRRRRRLATSAAVVLLCVSLFGVVAFHVILTEGQLDLERLRAEASSQTARNTRLRLEVAQLESPDWIVAAAGSFGMKPAENVTYLSPAGSARPKG